MFKLGAGSEVKDMQSGHDNSCFIYELVFALVASLCMEGLD